MSTQDEVKPSYLIVRTGTNSRIKPMVVTLSGADFGIKDCISQDRLKVKAIQRTLTKMYPNYKYTVITLGE